MPRGFDSTNLLNCAGGKKHHSPFTFGLLMKVFRSKICHRRSAGLGSVDCEGHSMRSASFSYYYYYTIVLFIVPSWPMDVDTVTREEIKIH